MDWAPRGRPRPGPGARPCPEGSLGVAGCEQGAAGSGVARLCPSWGRGGPLEPEPFPGPLDMGSAHLQCLRRGVVRGARRAATAVPGGHLG